MARKAQFGPILGMIVAVQYGLGPSDSRMPRKSRLRG
jgi:hypothetical protein